MLVFNLIVIRFWMNAQKRENIGWIGVVPQHLYCKHTTNWPMIRKS